MKKIKIPKPKQEKSNNTNFKSQTVKKRQEVKAKQGREKKDTERLPNPPPPTQHNITQRRQDTN